MDIEAQYTARHIRHTHLFHVKGLHLLRDLLSLYHKYYMTHEELIHALGRKWRINTLQLFTLCRHYNHYIDKDIPISTRSYKLCEKLGCSIMQLSRIIDKGIEIGLFRIINDKYGFNHLHSEDNKCRVYSINNEILTQLEEITNTLHMERIE